MGRWQVRCFGLLGQLCDFAPTVACELAHKGPIVFFKGRICKGRNKLNELSKYSKTNRLYVYYSHSWLFKILSFPPFNRRITSAPCLSDKYLCISLCMPGVMLFEIESRHHLQGSLHVTLVRFCSSPAGLIGRPLTGPQGKQSETPLTAVNETASNPCARKKASLNAQLTTKPQHLPLLTEYVGR